VLVEHYAGAFPVWLAPVQARLIPIADRHVAYAQEVAGRLQEAGLRIANGYGLLKDKTFRIAHMGETQLSDIENLLAELDAFLAQR
jgi:aspartate aminotransferase-like enzyme